MDLILVFFLSRLVGTSCVTLCIFSVKLCVTIVSSKLRCKMKFDLRKIPLRHIQNKG